MIKKGGDFIEIVKLTNIEINKKEKVVRINDKDVRPEKIIIVWDGGNLFLEEYTDGKGTIYSCGFSFFRKNKLSLRYQLYEFRYVIKEFIKPVFKTIFHIINAHFS